jgi:hypothetical protein
MSGEKRSARRKSLKYPARIELGDGTPSRECLLSDVSESGARVVLKTIENLPNQFTLLIGSLGAAPRVCKVVWRDEAELGLEFTGRPKSVSPELQPRRNS